MADPLRNECVQAIEAELEKFGLRWQKRVANNDHVEVSWGYEDGRQRRLRCSASPSDVFAHRKAAADARRILRADGVKPKINNVLSLAHALTAPKPTTPFVPSDRNRIETLEKLSDSVFDLLVEAEARVEAAQVRLQALEAKLANIKVTISFDEPSAVPAVVTKVPSIKTAGNGGPSDRVMVVLAHGAWVTTAVLQKETGVEVKNLASTLQYLRKKGLVENGQRGYWRKKPEHLIQSATG